MRRLPFVFLTILAVVSPYTIAGSDKNKPTKSAVPLNADEIAIYKAVLRTYNDDKDASLNVSAKTTAFDQPQCLNVQVENLSALSHFYHDLPQEVLPSMAMKIVDPKMQARAVHSNDPSNTIPKGKPVKDAVHTAFSTGLFSMSEIAFDKEHRFGVVTYSFWCGSLCGHGSTWVFEKVNGEWRKVRNCGGWIS